MSTWTIEEEVIVLGDTTTHGGKVVSASSSVFYNGIPVARVGDQVTCPKCSGSHTITSGAPHAFANGQSIARNNDDVSCGAKLISGSSQPTLTSLVETEEKSKRLIYVPHNETFHDTSPAVMYKGESGVYEFPPIAASYTITVTASVEGRKLRVFADGRTGLLALPNPPTIVFWASATISKEGKEIAKQTLKWGEHGYYLPDQTLKMFIGEANFILPEPGDNTPLTLIIVGGYTARFAEGTALPLGPNAKAVHQLPVMEAE